MSETATDAAVKQLADLEEKALTRIIGKITSPPNVLACNWIVFEEDLGFSTRFICRYELNGNKHEFQISKDKRRASGMNINQILAEVMEDFAKHFNRHFVPAILDTVKATFTPRTPISLGGHQV